MSNLDFSSFEVIADYATLGSRRRPGRAIDPGVKFVVAHDTGNPGASARAHARFYRNDPNPQRTSSAHLFVDDREIVETVPALTRAPEQALHVLYDRPLDNRLYGYDANRAAIGIEYCFGGGIDADEAYRRYVWTIAKVCNVFNLDPSRHVVGHQVLDPGRKTDPGQSLRRSGRSYELLLRDVVEMYRACAGGNGQIGSGRLAADQADTTVHLSVRARPTRLANRTRVLAPGTRVSILELVEGETVSGNNDWCRIGDSEFCWTGGFAAVRA